MTNLIEYAKEEFVRAGWLDPNTNTYMDDMQKAMCENILELLETIMKQGHSGQSIQYMLSIFNRLIQYRPINHLTGESLEWIEVSDDLLQNKY